MLYYNILYKDVGFELTTINYFTNECYFVAIKSKKSSVKGKILVSR